MNKKILISTAIALVALMSLGVSASMTGCGNGTNASMRQFYYNSTGYFNVTAGNICINGTSYDVDPTLSYSCTDLVTCNEGACSIEISYAGYAGDGTFSCTTTDSVASGWYYYVEYGMRINATTITSDTEVVGHGCSVENLSAEPINYTECSDNYSRASPTQFCNGAGVNATLILHVDAGEVCSEGDSVAPNSTNNCGIWSDCTEGSQTANRYYVGYGAGTSCTDTAWVDANQTVTYPTSQTIETTEHASSCAVTGIVYTNDDVSPSTMDTVGKIAVGFASVGSIIGILLGIGLLAYLAKKVTK